MLGLACVAASAWGQYVISTIAGLGPGNGGYSGDYGPPAAAELWLPTGMAYSKGVLYIADSGNHCIRQINGGTITTFAGTCGTAGFSGDGGAATEAELNSPNAVCVDPNGDVLIADTNNNVVRIVVPSGIISTFAGNQSMGGGYTGDGGLATNGKLDAPNAVVSDSAGNIYITDPVNNVIRKVNAVAQCIPGTTPQVCGNLFSTAVGTGATGGSLSHPNGLAVDAAFSIYVSDTSHRVLKFSNGGLTVIAGTGNIGGGINIGDGGPATKALLNNPVGLSLDAAGNLYITDSNEFRVRMVNPAGIISTIAGGAQSGYLGDGGLATSALLDFPHLAIPDGNGNIYISDTENNVIRFLTLPGATITANGVGSAASFQPPISPGSLATLVGNNLAVGTSSFSTTPLPTTLGQASVTINGATAPILYASPTQINFQVPWETATGNATVSVTVNGSTSAQVTVPVVAAAPAIFFLSSSQAAIENQDFSVNSSTNPAHLGTDLIVYMTGSGPVTPAVADGAVTPSTGLTQTTLPVSATIGGMSAHVAFSGLAPGFVGLMQMNIAIPTGLTEGTYPLTITLNGVQTNAATISVIP